MYRQSTRTSLYASQSSVTMPPLAAPPEEVDVAMTAPMIRHMQRDVPQKKKNKPRYLPGEKLLKLTAKLNPIEPEPEPEPEPDLDLDMIGNSINTVLERMRL